MDVFALAQAKESLFAWMQAKGFLTFIEYPVVTKAYKNGEVWELTEAESDRPGTYVVHNDGKVEFLRGKE